MSSPQPKHNQSYSSLSTGGKHGHDFRKLWVKAGVLNCPCNGQPCQEQREARPEWSKPFHPQTDSPVISLDPDMYSAEYQESFHEGFKIRVDMETELTMEALQWVPNRHIRGCHCFPFGDPKSPDPFEETVFAVKCGGKPLIVIDCEKCTERFCKLFSEKMGEKVAFSKKSRTLST